MKCEQCGFIPQGDCEELDANHVYCVCRAIIHLSSRTLTHRFGRCKCGWAFGEACDGSALWTKPGECPVVMKSDPDHAW